MNILDEKPRKKFLYNLELLKSSVSKEIDFDATKKYETNN
jgi:hypothetical protein